MAEENKEAKWYAVHTYSGYEKKVKDSIEKFVDNRGMQDQILEVSVPEEEVIRRDSETGSEKIVKQKIFPGYVLVKMMMNDNTWYVVRNIRGVTGFVGPGSDPVPLSDEEVERLGNMQSTTHADYEIGESVNVIDGPIKGTGRITAIDEETDTVTVAMPFFGGQENSIDVSFSQIEKVH